MSYRTISVVLNDLNIATREFMKDTVSAINNDNYFSARLLKKSEPFTGGEKISVPLKYGRENTKTMSPYQEYDLQSVDILDKAQYDIRHVHGDMVIDQMRLEVQNIGKAADIKLARTKAENIGESMRHKFSNLLFTSVANLESTDPDSLIKICATTDNTVGGINAQTENRFNWNPHVLDYEGESVTYANLIDPLSAYYIEKLLRMLVGPLTIGNEKPTLALTNQAVWDALEEVYRADERVDARHMDVDMGFDVLKFRSMKIAVDSHVPGGKLNTVSDSYGMLIAVNEKYLGYQHSPRINFKWTTWYKLQTRPVYSSLLDWFGAVVCSRRDRQGAIKGLPTEVQVYGT
ncbi:MAG: phage major capsid protein [Planctomycetota bacterium]